MRSAGIDARNGALGKIRTPDPQIRSLVLYPAELRARNPAPVKYPALGWRTIGEAPDAGKTLSAGQQAVFHAITFARSDLSSARQKLHSPQAKNWRNFGKQG